MILELDLTNTSNFNIKQLSYKHLVMVRKIMFRIPIPTKEAIIIKLFLY